MTSIPASRKARATTFAPRSWPSRPGFAIRTRIFCAIGTTSVQERLFVGAKDFAHDVADLAQGRLRADGVEEERHRVVVRFAGFPKAVEGRCVLLLVPRSTELAEPLQLRPERCVRDPELLEVRLLVHGEIIHPDDDPFLVLDLPLVPVGGVRDLLLEEP